MTTLRECSWITDFSKLCQLLLKVYKKLFLNCSTAVKPSENRKKQKKDWDYTVF